MSIIFGHIWSNLNNEPKLEKVDDEDDESGDAEKFGTSNFQPRMARVEGQSGYLQFAPPWGVLWNKAQAKAFQRR